MEIASGLMDGIGPRLTGSPNMQRANDWTMKKLEEFGLANAHLEALPRAWTAPTNGPVRAQVVHVRATKSEELEEYKGKVAGKIILLGDAAELKPHEQGQFSRYNEKTLADLSQYDIPGKPQWPELKAF